MGTFVINYGHTTKRRYLAELSLFFGATGQGISAFDARSETLRVTVKLVKRRPRTWRGPARSFC